MGNFPQNFYGKKERQIKNKTEHAVQSYAAGWDYSGSIAKHINVIAKNWKC